MTDNTTQPGGLLAVLGALARAITNMLASGVQPVQEVQQTAGTPAPAKAPASLIHPEAEALIVAAEVTDQRTYERLYARPTWPQGDSGVTIGIGYDLGYVTAGDVDRDWPMLPAQTRNRLKTVAGLKAAKAQAALSGVKDITIPWDAALQVFRAASLPVYADKTRTAFPGAAHLPLRCFGVLVSLVYNRGAGMTDAKDDTQQRRREMRQVRDAVAAGDLDLVPGYLRSMKRLWPTMGGLRTRRENEACLWEKGLLVHLLSAGTLTTGSRGPEVAALQRALGVTADGAFGPKTRTAVEQVQAAHKLPVTGVVDHATAAALGVG